MSDLHLRQDRLCQDTMHVIEGTEVTCREGLELSLKLKLTEVKMSQ
jgi:hypothetical protein